jgi:hypothetical protein
MAIGTLRSLIPGQTWTTGSGVPSASSGFKTQFYLDTSTGKIYEKTDTSTWVERGTINPSGGAAVTSVNTKTGDVSLTSGDIPEGANLYFTDGRAKTAAVVDSTSGMELDRAPSVHAAKEYVTNSVASEAAARTAADALLVPLSQKGVADGVATLDNTGKIPSTQIPATAITSVTVVQTIAERDALSPGEGDFCVVTDTSETFIYDGAAWVELIIGSAVISVNGKTGAVSLSTTDISEGTKLYYTDARAKLAAVINSSTGSETDKAMSVAVAKMYTDDAVETEKLAREAADALLIPLTQKGAANGVATLDSTSKIPADQIPAGIYLPSTGGTMTGPLAMAAQNEIRFADADSSNYVGFKGPLSVSTDKIWTLPAVDGVSGQVLTTDGSSVLSWTDGIGIKSINGDTTPIITLDASDVGALPITGGTLTGELTVTNGDLIVGSVRSLKFMDADGTNYVGLRAPSVVTTDKIWSLPSADGSNGQLLTTDGSGNLSWVSFPSTSDFVLKTGDTMTGNLTLGAPAGSRKELRFNDSDSSNYVGFRGASNATSNIIWELPGSDGSSGQLLSTNGNKLLQWVNPTDTSAFVQKTGSSMTGPLRLNFQQEVRFSSGGDASNYVAFFAPSGLSQNISLRLPSNYGFDGQVLMTDGFGGLSWGGLPPTDNFLLKTGGTMTGALIMDNYLEMKNENAIRFTDPSTLNYIGFKAPASGLISSTRIWTLPFADGSSGQVLSTNGSGTLSWVSIPSTSNFVARTGSTMIGTLGMQSRTQIQFYDTNNSNYVALRAADDVTSSTIWSLPPADGTNGQALITDGSANLSWTSIPSTANFIQKSGDSMTGALTMNAENEIRFADADSSNYVALKAASSIASNVSWTLPAADGAVGQFLSTDGGGTLSWVSQGAGAISSVNGQTGVVVLTASDVGAVSAAELTIATTSLQDALIAETNARIANSVSLANLTILVTSIQDALIAETNARIAASQSSASLSLLITSIQDAIIAETNARIATSLSQADLTVLSTAVQEAITEEANARIAEVKWLYGSGSPSPSVGKDNDFYMDLSLKQILQKQSGSWISIGTLN